jgi:hypothetical protein
MIEEFSKEDLFKILKFYKDKTSELEFQYLILQINNGKEVEKLNKELLANKEFFDQSILEIKESSLQSVYTIKEEKDKTIEALKKKNKELTKDKSTVKK